MRYVAMGSSFAAGPRITTPADEPATRCGRSADNYAHVLARTLDLRLADVSCSGATTAHLLGPWGDLPPQLDALTSDTRLVTVTIGGNDVDYIGGLTSASCRHDASSAPAEGTCPAARPVAEDAWTKLDTVMRRIAMEVHRRSPDARLVFVDYIAMLPSTGTCAATPLSAEDAGAARTVARRLADLTARVAAETEAEVLKASAMSRGHDACSADPWASGFSTGDGAAVPYHPNARGMAAIADALARRLRR